MPERSASAAGSTPTKMTASSITALLQKKQTMQQIMQKRQPPPPTPAPPHQRRSRSTSRHNTPTRRRSRSRSNTSRVSIGAFMPEYEDSTTEEVVNTYGSISRISGYEPVRELSPSVPRRRSSYGCEKSHPRDRARKIDQWVAQAIQVKTIDAKPSTTKAGSEEATIKETSSKPHRRSQSLTEKYPPPPKMNGINPQSPHLSRKRGKSSSSKRRESAPQKRPEDHLVAVRDLSLLVADQESSKKDALTGLEINCGWSNVSSMTTLLSFDTATTSSFGTNEDGFLTSKQLHQSRRREKQMPKKISERGADMKPSKFSAKNICAHDGKYSGDNSRQRSCARSLSTASLTDTDTESSYTQCTVERQARALVSELKREVNALDKKDYGRRKDQRPSGILRSRSFSTLQDDGVEQTKKTPFKNRSPILNWRRKGSTKNKADRRKSTCSQGTAPTVSTGMSAWLGDLEDEEVLNREVSLNSECF